MAYIIIISIIIALLVLIKYESFIKTIININLVVEPHGIDSADNLIYLYIFLYFNYSILLIYPIHIFLRKIMTLLKNCIILMMNFSFDISFPLFT